MLYPCKFGSVKTHAMTPTALASAPGNSSARTISDVKKGDVIFLNITEAYATSATYNNATQIGSQRTWQDGSGSTWGFDVVIQATADGTVTINKTGNGSFQAVYYSKVTLS